MTRQDNNSTESKVTLVAYDNYKKVPIAFGEITALRARRHSAVQGTDAMVPLEPWPVPGHQRLDARQSPLGASQHAKKKTFFFKKQKRFIFSNTINNIKNLPTFLATSP